MDMGENVSFSILLFYTAITTHRTNIQSLVSEKFTTERLE